MNTNNIDTFKFLFQNLSVRELNDRINFFRENICIRDLSENRIREELKKIFTININNENVSFFLNTDIQTYPYHIDYFFRIRKFEKLDYNGINSKTFSSIQKRQDVLCRPDSDVKEYGRLNRPNKSVLYVSKQVANAIYETKCNYDEFFFLIVYKSNSSLRFSQIQNIKYMDELTEEENSKRIIMHNFLFSEFTKYVPKGREFEYKTSLLIYEDYFWNPNIDGFCYPSIASTFKSGFNLCFTQEKACEKLDIVEVLVCKLHPSKGESEFQIEIFYEGLLNNDDSFSFYEQNSEILKDKLGDFRMIRDIGILN